MFMVRVMFIKVIDTTKSFIEDGSRAEYIASNPHSCVHAFSVWMLK